MNWYKISQSKKDSGLIKQAESDKSIKDIKDDIRDLKSKFKDLEKEVKEVKKDIKDLNIGSRRFSEAQNIFNSLQRKMERMEAVTQEWNNYKKEMDAKTKQMVEKHNKARIKDITPQAY